jgi:glycosyltransferase involved in cell wall biosynthesis
LYITYDGLTDPLGQSQVLPYILGLEQHGYKFIILSFEKKERFQKNNGYIKALMSRKNIEWVPLSFTENPPVVSKFYDAIRMKVKAIQLYRKKKFDMVHCRSYIAADAGLLLKKKFAVKFFFDMRGFWADEKKDGGSWNISNPIYSQVYKYYKKKEKDYLQNADYIISLTEAGKKEMLSWPFFDKKVPLQVIPCCADMEIFSLTNAEQKQKSKENLGIATTDLVISYLGSVGTWYMLDEMLNFFKQVKKSYATARFLFVTHTPSEVIVSKLQALGLSQKDVIITPASRKEVPFFIKSSDINISFIRPVYSKISSSPTKLGEVLSMGIPVICNSGVGDVEEIVTQSGGGYIIHKFDEMQLQNAVDAIPELIQKQPLTIRNNIQHIYSLTKGIESYVQSYATVLNC